MKSNFFLYSSVVILAMIYTPILAQENTKRNIVNYNTLKHHTIFFSQDFYTFDDIGSNGFFPTGLSIGYQYAWEKKRDYLIEFNASTFGTSYHPLGGILNFKHIYSNNKPLIGKYTYESRFFYTLSGIFKTSILFKPLFVGAGVHYIFGVNGLQSIEPGIGYVFMQKEVNTFALSLSASYHYAISKHFIIEPHIRYEYLLNDNEPHYLVGVKGGYAF